ncbi:MAG: C-GCAxxG-C-C family protein [Clostridiales Family XIII bacterium]|jgi:C_GCAxxG_C_C family probable redox protein|nr:C-GCAxxG-C-C family protein [Clostridiales Family XIII bacterium]
MNMNQNEQTERICKEKMKGHCCSQAIMSLSLEDLGKENEDLIVAMTGFCSGMGRGEICGSLAGAIAALHVCDTQKATSVWQDEFMDWFCERFGAYDCRDITAGDKERQNGLCLKLILETYFHLQNYIRPSASPARTAL